MSIRNMRNFWIEGQVDGLKNDIGTGSRSKDGSMEFKFYQNNNGESEQVVRVRGTGYNEVKKLYVICKGNIVYTHETERDKEHVTEGFDFKVVGDVKDVLLQVTDMEIAMSYRLKLMKYIIENSCLPAGMPFTHVGIIEWARNAE